MDKTSLNILKNREDLKYSNREMVLRILWALLSPLFRFSPRPLFGWRRFILRLFGAKIGEHVHIYSSAVIYMPWNLEVGRWSSIGEYAFIYNLGKVRIGDKATISCRVHICAGTHDYTRSDMPLLKPSITICDQAWICTDAFIGPRVVVGEGAVVGARAVAIKDIPAWKVVAGNPARTVKERTLADCD